MSRTRAFAIGLIAIAVMAAGAVTSGDVASADTIAAPASPAVTFAGWSAGTTELAVTWTPEAAVDGYEIDFAAGSTAPTTPGAGAVNITGADSDSGTLPISTIGGQLSVAIWAYTGTPGNYTGLSQPATKTIDVPGPPALTATPVTGVQGEAILNWSEPTFAADTFVLRAGPGSGNGPTGGAAVTIVPGQTAVVVNGLANYSPSNNYAVALYELQDGNPDHWSSPSGTLAYAAPGPETLVNPAESNDATHLSLTWLPASCTALPGQYCIYSVLVENPGTKVAATPSDGTLETSATGTPDGTSAHISGVVPGNTYTFTVFNVATIHSVEYWSAGDSETIHDLATPTVNFTSSPAKTATAGQAVTLTAKLTTVGTNPTGTVTFRTASHVLCTAALTAAHVAQCGTTAALIGLQGTADPESGITMSADYNGDTTDAPSSADLSLMVKRVAPTATIKASGQHTKKATMTLTVGGPAGAATGMVTMTSKSHRICQATLHSGRATCSATAKMLGGGKHSVTIHYAGDTSYLAHSAKVSVTLKK